MAATNAPEEARPLLTPDAVNPPPPTSQPTERYHDDDSVPHHDDNIVPAVKSGTEFEITFVTIVRLIVFIFVLTNIVLQLISIPNIFASIFLVILSFITLFWTIFSLVPLPAWGLCFGKGQSRKRHVPDIGFIVGRTTYYVSGGDDDEVGGHKKSIGSSIADFALALLILLFTIDAITNPGWRRAPYGSANEVITAFHFTVM
jgi:hypothetical protein